MDIFVTWANIRKGFQAHKRKIHEVKGVYNVFLCPGYTFLTFYLLSIMIVLI